MSDEYRRSIEEYRQRLEREMAEVSNTDDTLARMRAGEKMFRFEHNLDAEEIIWAKNAVQAEKRFSEKHGAPFDPETMTLYELSCGWRYLKGKERPTPWDI